MTMPVLLGPSTPEHTDLLTQVAADAESSAGDVAGALTLARSLGAGAPLPGGGRTRQLWELLATLAAADLTVARVVEPHLDALAILAEAGHPSDESAAWGVFAAEGPGMRVTADAQDQRWQLSGTKPWCSLAGVLDRALVTAHSGDARRLFAVDLHDSGIQVHTGGWVARGLAAVTSEQIELSNVSAAPVGEDNWYLTRPGFAWGGIGVAAVWFGASVAIARAIRNQLAGREPDQIGLMLLGEADTIVTVGRATLAYASAEVDDGCSEPAILAQRVRSIVSAGAERMLALAGHALGPGPMATNEEHARRMADLELYLRQDHAERDLARLGSKVLGLVSSPW